MMSTLKLIFRPVLMKWKKLLSVIKVKSSNPTIKLGDNVLVANVTFGKYVYLASDIIVKNSTINDFSYCGEGTQIKSSIVGKFTCIGPNVSIGLGRHPVGQNVSIHPAFYSLAEQVGTTFASEQVFNESPEPTRVGNDVWIGANVSIPGGVSIGNGAVIASGSVVTKDVRSYEIVGGVPAKFIRWRFEENDINFLNKTCWWDKEEEWLRKHALYFKNIDRFCVLLEGNDNKE